MEAREIVFATNNGHKLEEVRQMLGARGWHVLSLGDLGCAEDIPENGATLEENALAKARWVREHYERDCFADDTGLEVRALGGAPGVHSARYAALETGAADHDSRANMALLLHRLSGKLDRRAAFRTVMALCLRGKEYTVEGRVDGHITHQPHGTDGFGYDPIFRPAGQTLTFAEMSAQEKNAISHRRRALENLVHTIENIEQDTQTTK